MKILITGFDPFGGDAINPAWEAVKQLPPVINNAVVITAQIPTVFEKSIEKLLESIKEHNPDTVLCVGQAGGRLDISIERVAININDARIPDNIGQQPIDTNIYNDGDSAYFTTLPIKRIVNELRNKGIPSTVSNTAGTFVCNHIMYALLYHINKNHIAKQGGFIHVPYIPEQVANKSPLHPSMSLDMITQGLTQIIHTIADKSDDLKISAGTEY